MIKQGDLTPLAGYLRRMATPEFSDSLRSVSQILIREHALKNPITFLGTGKSAYLALRFSKSLTSLGIKSQFAFLNEIGHGDAGMFPRGGVVVLVSKSGSEIDNEFLQEYKKKYSLCLIAMIATDKGNVREFTDFQINVGTNGEVGRMEVIPSYSLTATSFAFDLLLGEILSESPSLEQDFLENHPSGAHSHILNLRIGDISTGLENLTLCSPSDSLETVLTGAKRAKLGTIFVTSSDSLLGIVGGADIRKLLASGMNSRVAVHEIMNSKFEALEADSNLRQALEKGKSLGFSIFPVFQQKKFVGALSLDGIWQLAQSVEKNGDL